MTPQDNGVSIVSTKSFVGADTGVNVEVKVEGTARKEVGLMVEVKSECHERSLLVVARDVAVVAQTCAHSTTMGLACDRSRLFVAIPLS
jgi:hypothetical protein